jgi:thioredoxin 1
MMSKEIEITDATFDQEVLQSNIPVLIDFWAPWCGPCRMIAPIVDQIANEYDGKIKVGKINTDDNQRIAAQYGIRSIPTLMIFSGGELRERLIGVQPKAILASKIDEVLA